MVEYWEAWTEPAGQILVHHGRIGERGKAQRTVVAVGGADERLAALAERQRRRGFHEIDSCELGIVLVQWPDERAHGELHGPAIAWLRDILGWTGLGDYVGFDDSAGLTLMGEAIDPELAADVLSSELETSGLPTDALIAISALEDVIQWPPARRGERFDAPQGDHDRELDLRAVGAVVFATGYRPAYAGWIDVPGAFAERGFPFHVDGASTAAGGLYFSGVHFLRKRKSSLLIGVGEDAALVAKALVQGTSQVPG